MELSTAGILRDAVVVVDEGAAAVIRWLGGGDFLLNECHCSSIVPLEQCCPSMRNHVDLLMKYQQSQEQQQHQSMKIVVFVVVSIWECCDEVLAALRFINSLVGDCSIESVCICCSISEKAHAHTAPIAGPTPDATINFQQLAATLQQMLSNEMPALSACISIRHIHMHYLPILHNMRTNNSNTTTSAFTLSNKHTANIFPLSLSDMGDNASMYTTIAEASVEHVPNSLKMMLRLLSETLSSVMQQLRLDVHERSYAVGFTSKIVGNAVVSTLNNSNNKEELQPATLVVVDRSIDMVTPSGHTDTLLDRIVKLLPDDHVCRKYLTATTSTTTNDCCSCCVADDMYSDADICHPDDFSVQKLLSSLALTSERDSKRQLQQHLVDIIKSESLQLPQQQSTTTDLQQLLQTIMASPQSGHKHRAVVQVVLSLLLSQQLTGNTVHDELRSIEHMQHKLMATSSDAARSSLLMQLCDLMQQLQYRVDACKCSCTCGSSCCSCCSCCDGVVSVYDVTLLAIHAYSLMGPIGFDRSSELELINAVVVAVLHVAAATRRVDRCSWMSDQLHDSLMQHAPALKQHIQAQRQRKQQQQQANSSNCNDDEDDGSNDDGWGDGWGADDDLFDDEQQPAQGPEPVQTTTDTAEPAQTTTDTADTDADTDPVPSIDPSTAASIYESLKLQMADEVHEMVDNLKNRCGSARAGMHELQSLTTTTSSSTDKRCGTLAHVCDLLYKQDHQQQKHDIVQVGTALQELGRAGLDLLKSGFASLGFGSSAPATPHPTDTSVLVVFVVGGFTVSELREVHTAMDQLGMQVIVGGTTIASGDTIASAVFNPVATTQPTMNTQ